MLEGREEDFSLESEDLFEQAQREQEQEEYSDFQEEEDDLI